MQGSYLPVGGTPGGLSPSFLQHPATEGLLEVDRRQEESGGLRRSCKAPPPSAATRGAHPKAIKNKTLVLNASLMFLLD